MLKNPWIFLLWLMLGLNAVQGAFPTSVAELSDNDSLETVRRVKAEQIHRYMNEAADPCEDFYEFTCANYAQYNTFAKDSNIFYTVQKLIQNKMKSMLESDDINDSVMDINVKNFYKSCNNYEQYKEFNKQSLHEYVNNFGSVPMLEGDNWRHSEFDWSKIVGKIFYKTGISILIDVAVATNLSDNSINSIFVGEPMFASKQKGVYNDNEFVRGQKNMAIYTLEQLFDLDETLAIQTAIEVIDFEVALVQGMSDVTLGITQSERYTPISIDNAQRKYLPDLDVKQLIGDSLDLRPTDIYVGHQYLENALNVVKRTPKKIVANYIFYKLAQNFLKTGECLKKTHTVFHKFLENSLYRKDFTPQLEVELFSFWREMKKTFRDTLFSPRLDWMQNETKKYALEKLKSMKLNVLSYKDYDFVQEFNELELSDRNYIENLQSVLSLRGRQARSIFYEKPQSEDSAKAASFSPVYDPQSNNVYIAMAHLQPFQLWSSSYPNAYNFATLGALIGHEIVHGFDNIGRNYDAQGLERVWWDSYSTAEFNRRVQCFRDQYSNYIYEGLPLGDKPSQGENIADHGGLRLAYAAYLKWYAKQSSQDRNTEYMPGLNYTHKQLFFISYAQIWCESVDPKRIAQYRADSHTPIKLRAVSALLNYDEFWKEFNCPRGSSMHPETVCEIY